MTNDNLGKTRRLLDKFRDAAEKTKSKGVRFDDFVAYMPTHKYIFMPTNEHWPAESVNAQLPRVPRLYPDGKPMLEKRGKNKGVVITIPAHMALDEHNAVQSLTWAPGEGQYVAGKLFTRSGWIDRPGLATYNEYRPPVIAKGNPAGAQRWKDLLAKLYPNDVDHIAAYCAHRIQKPGEKINHAILLAGSPGIGKDTLLEPLCYGVGADNFKEASPQDIMGQWSDYLCSVVLRISEARDLGEFDRFKFYEKTKTIFAAPPHTHRINTKFKPQFYAVNVCGCFITTNHSFDGLFIPADDRRHYVAATEITAAEVTGGNESFWPDFWGWYHAGGLADVVAYLAAFDLKAAKFDPKAPPKKTEAFWTMVGAGAHSEVPELADVLDRIGAKQTPPATVMVNGKPKPCGPAAVTVDMVTDELASAGGDLHDWLRDRKNRRSIPHRFASCGYLPVRNNDRNDGLWIIKGKRLVVYARRDLSPGERFKAAEQLDAAEAAKAAEGIKVISDIIERKGGKT